MTGAPARRLLLGIATIGQTPRPDLATAFAAGTPHADVQVVGALDHLAPAAIAAFVVVACAGDFPVIPCAVPVLLPGRLAPAAVMQRSAVALVVLDCMGHDEGYRTEFARFSGRPTLAIQALAAGIAGALL